jgi:hypothetical protein
MPYVNKPRPYKKEYEEYHASEEQKKKRAMRNAARRQAMKNGTAKKGDGKDVHHTKALSQGGSNKDGLKVVSASNNRSFKRNADNKLVSETSTRERKRANTK